MKLLALSINNTPIPAPPNFNPNLNNLGSVISGLFTIAVYISGTLLLAWLSWGIFQYIFAGGDKEGLSKAQKRITWAIVGFIIVAIAWAAGQYVQGIFPADFSKVTPISIPKP